MKGHIGQSLEFLNTKTELRNGLWVVAMKTYFKPTDAKRYLNRRSNHPQHTFSSIPYSQFRRVVVTCSDNTYKAEAMGHMETKLYDSGYKTNEINTAK